MTTETHKDVKIPVCPNCKRKSIYFRKDGSVMCRACGYDGMTTVGTGGE